MIQWRAAWPGIDEKQIERCRPRSAAVVGRSKSDAIPVWRRSVRRPGESPPGRAVVAGVRGRSATDRGWGSHNNSGKVERCSPVFAAGEAHSFSRRRRTKRGLVVSISAHTSRRSAHDGVRDGESADGAGIGGAALSLRTRRRFPWRDLGAPARRQSRRQRFIASRSRAALRH